MTLIKFINLVVKAVEELLYLIACVLVTLWQYRYLIVSYAILGSIMLGAFIIYIERTNGGM